MILGTHVLNTRDYARLDALLIRIGKSRVVSCYSRDIGNECLPHTTIIRFTGGVMEWYVWWRPRLFSEKVLRPQCVIHLLSV